MKPRPRTRRIILWSAAILSLLIAVAWAGSAWWRLTWTPRRGYIVQIDEGQLSLVRFDQDLPRFYIARRIDVLPPYKPLKPRLSWRFDWYRFPEGGCLLIPLWPLFSASGGIAGVAWWRETIARRRKRLQLCLQCAYDRRGLDSAAACPECGEKR